MPSKRKAAEISTAPTFTLTLKAANYTKIWRIAVEHAQNLSDVVEALLVEDQSDSESEPEEPEEANEQDPEGCC